MGSDICQSDAISSCEKEQNHENDQDCEDVHGESMFKKLLKNTRKEEPSKIFIPECEMSLAT